MLVLKLSCACWGTGQRLVQSSLRVTTGHPSSFYRLLLLATALQGLPSAPSRALALACPSLV